MSDAPEWPDEATVERAAEAVYESISAGWSTALPWGLAHDDWRSEARQCARAALKVLPDPTADTVLLDKIRAEIDKGGSYSLGKRIMALLDGDPE